MDGREYVGVSECVNVLEQGGKRYGVAKLSKLVLAFIIINYQADWSKIKELGVAAFIFYDTETSGLDKNFGQIFQFAAVLTDNELSVIDKFEIRSRRMPQIVPEPSALLVTGINPETLDQAEYSYYEFATKIRDKILEWSPAIVCGYNTFSFDEHFMRSMFYQNLYPPYLTQINGNSRLDICLWSGLQNTFNPVR